MLIAQSAAAFSFGLRHGADPDHLAAIDVVTRNSYRDRPWLSRFVGAMFAGGHSVMVLSVAGIAGGVAGALERSFPGFEGAARIANVTILIAIAVANVVALRRGAAPGVRVRLLPRFVRASRNPWIAVPIGLLFGLGFETSGQVATFALAASADAGALGGLAVGGAFCAGVALTDLADGILVHRFVSDPATQAGAQRGWAWTMTAIALVVAGWQAAELGGWSPPFSELTLSGGIVLALCAAFALTLARSRTDVAQGGVS